MWIRRFFRKKALRSRPGYAILIESSIYSSHVPAVWPGKSIFYFFSILIGGMSMISNSFPFTDFETFGMPRTRAEVLEHLQADGFAYQQFLTLTEPLQQDFLSFCMGTRGAKLTCDPFFKFVFDPQKNPHRLEEFLSLCLGVKLSVVAVLPNESSRLSEEGSLLIMDILVRLESGALVNVEIQRVGYYFPGPRCACYSSDLVMRQYSQVQSNMKKKGKRFSYRDIKKVYTIVLIQSSSREFHLFPDEYLHYAKQTFNTGLQMDLIQEYLIIPLDIFLKCPHNKITRLDAWLYFIASDDPADILRVIEAYPDFKLLYREVFQFRFMTKELVNMFSEGLRLLDAGTVQYMIEDQQAQIEQLKQKLKQQQEWAKQQQEQAKQQQEQAAEDRAEIVRLKALLAK